MCGLVGFIGKPSRKYVDAFHNLLWWDISRGVHATGVVAGFKKESGREYMMKKAVGLPIEVINQEDYINKVENKDCYPFMLLGHNRFATKGAKDDPKGAHPYDMGDVILMHNGTLTGDSFGLNYKKEFITDSMQIAHKMNEGSPAEVWGELQGAAALVWLDKRDGTVNFLRNKERTLFFAWCDNKRAIFYSSEEWMIENLTRHNRIKHDKIFPFTLNRHFKVKMGDNGVLSYTSEEYAPYVAPVSFYKKKEKKEEKKGKILNSPPQPGTGKRIPGSTDRALLALMETIPGVTVNSFYRGDSSNVNVQRINKTDAGNCLICDEDVKNSPVLAVNSRQAVCVECRDSLLHHNFTKLEPVTLPANERKAA